MLKRIYNSQSPSINYFITDLFCAVLIPKCNWIEAMIALGGCFNIFNWASGITWRAVDVMFEEKSWWLHIAMLAL